MIDKAHKLAIRGQCRLLELSRSSAYNIPPPESTRDLELCRLIDGIHLARPFLGSRRISDELRDEGRVVNRKCVRRLMKLMGIRALYPRPRTSDPAKGHKVYPYLLRDLEIARPGQVWAMDITYIPMERGFLYLSVVMDWHSRRILAWRLANTLEACHCVAVLEEALSGNAAPEIVNTDQGSQFTGEEFTAAVLASGALLSMDGRGCWRDNVMVERLWRSLKYEEVYLKAYGNVADAHAGIRAWISYYNTQRRHQSLGKQTPDEVYYGNLQPLEQHAA